jgi:hypothetical protein
MVFHVLLFQPRSDLSGVDREALVASLESALAAIPSIRRMHIGRRVRHGALYEGLMDLDLGYAAVIEFDDLNGLRAYLEHPAHADLGARFMRSLESGFLYDYEMWDASRAAALAGQA